VPSRRLGRSLGVDLVPYKHCSYDCVYCQLGRTTTPCVERQLFAPVESVLEELATQLEQEPKPDYIGLAGSGEPTLHLALGELIAGIKAMTNVPVAVISNGSLLWQAPVREAVAAAEVVLPSLDAGDAAAFRRINRPHPSLDFERMVEGLQRFAADYRGQMWLEVFVFGDLRERASELEQLVEHVARIRPHGVQLNTVARPPAESSLRAASRSELEWLKGCFTVPCEIIAELPRQALRDEGACDGADSSAAILALLQRRPCSLEGLARGLARPPNALLKGLDLLLASGSVQLLERDGERVYIVSRPAT